MEGFAVNRRSLFKAFAGAALMPLAPARAAAVVPPVAAAAVAAEKSTIVHLHGEVFERDQVRAFIEAMNKAMRDGGTIFLQ